MLWFVFRKLKVKFIDSLDMWLHAIIFTPIIIFSAVIETVFKNLDAHNY